MRKRLIVGWLFIWLLSVISPVAGQFNDEGFKFMKVFNLIDSRYVDTVNMNKLTDETIRDMLHKLDPHSVYITKDEAEAMNEPLVGNFEGIGVSFNIFKDTIMIVSPIPGGPSEKLGIRAGDRIVKIADENVAGTGITTKQVFAKLRGKKGTIVKVDIKRHGINDLISFMITRDKIPIFSIDAAYKVDINTGYIRLSRFSATTTSEINETLKKFKKEGISNIILDLSGNGGGYLDAAVSLADEFLETNRQIVFTLGAHSLKKEYFSTSNGLFESGKLVIITDEGTASASEIVAGAIQDWDRGIIIGRRSFGKGLVQNPFTFSDGSIIRLTVARYYTPTGRLIQKPYADGYEEYANDLTNRFSHGELSNKDSIHFTNASKYYTLQRKRVVYGGGGIMPDVFVPIDTTAFSASYQKIVARGILNDFVLNYVDENRDNLKIKYPYFQNFKTNFIIDSIFLQRLVAYASQKSLVFKTSDFEKSKHLLAVTLKASIARDLWGSSEFYEILNSVDPSYNKSIEVLSKWNSYFSK
jgi:carboxyl-terminal processing protease